MLSLASLQVTVASSGALSTVIAVGVVGGVSSPAATSTSQGRQEVTIFAEIVQMGPAARAGGGAGVVRVASSEAPSARPSSMVHRGTRSRVLTTDLGMLVPRKQAIGLTALLRRMQIPRCLRQEMRQRQEIPAGEHGARIRTRPIRKTR